MKKRIIPFILICAMLLAVAVSCGNNPGGGGGTTPTKEAKLELGYFRDYYAIGDTESKVTGTLYYTDTKGNVTTIPITKDGKVSEGVTVEGFDTSAATEGETKKTVTLSYKGKFCTGTYKVFDLSRIEPSGSYIVSVGSDASDKNTVYSFLGDGTVEVEKYKSWADYLYFEEPTKTTTTCKVDVSPSGKPLVKVAGDTWSYYLDDDGNLRDRPEDSEYFDTPIEETDPTNKYIPDSHFYVSLAAEDSRSYPGAAGKYLVIAFNYTDPTKYMYMWFVDDTDTETLQHLNYSKPALTVSADKFSFNNAGVYLEKQDIGTDPAGTNLNIILKNDGYHSTVKAFTIVSHSDSDRTPYYKGYSYIMKRVDVKPAFPEEQE